MGKESEIFNYLHELGCCLNCSARYLCDKTIDFTNIDDVIKEKNLLRSETSEDEAQATKKLKGNPCIVCLGLLQVGCNEDILNHDELKKVDEYDSQVFTVSISYPPSILIRERAIRLHLEDKFPEFFNDDNIEIPINRVWKMFIKVEAGAKINKQFQNSDICDFSINVSIEYPDDDIELQVLREMQPKLFEIRTTQHRKYNGELFSRKGVLDALARTQSGVFKMYGKVPPEIPNAFVRCKSIECKHNSVYIAGRYCKYSRELSQSPWCIDGVKMMETSVQEIIFEEVSKTFRIPEANMKFSSSGREDCDVRCLGKGRPFYIEFSDPKKTEFAFEEFRKIEEAINKSSIVKVTDMQRVERSQLSKIKEGEETKTKTYIALCTTKVTVSDEMIENINNYGPLEMEQKTPIRVLHRRPLAIRKKKILEMKASLVQEYPNCFELHVTSQAGTYIKEFVHGDFGRTKPNIGDIIQTEVDIIALDVLSIDLDWPPAIKYEQ